MITIPVGKLFHRGTVNNEIKIKYIKLNDIICDNSEFQKAKIEIRALLRSKQTLDSVKDDLSSFLARYYKDSDHPNLSYSLEPRSILTHCLMMYRSCFVKGEGIFPLEALNLEIRKNEFHILLRDLGDKLIGHLDANCEYRIDTILWDFEIDKDRIIPKGPSLTFVKALDLHKEDIIKWLLMIQDILEKIDERVSQIAEAINLKMKFDS